MLNQYFEDSSDDQLLGNYIFADNGENVFQIEVQTNIINFSISLTRAFSVISALTDVAKTNFTRAIVIFHLGNKLPIIAKSDLNCSRKFFIEQTQMKYNGEKNAFLFKLLTFQGIFNLNVSRRLEWCFCSLRKRCG